MSDRTNKEALPDWVRELGIPPKTPADMTNDRILILESRVLRLEQLVATLTSNEPAKETIG